MGQETGPESRPEECNVSLSEESIVCVYVYVCMSFYRRDCVEWRCLCPLVGQTGFRKNNRARMKYMQDKC